MKTEIENMLEDNNFKLKVYRISLSGALKQGEIVYFPIKERNVFLVIPYAINYQTDTSSQLSLDTWNPVWLEKQNKVSYFKRNNSMHTCIGTILVFYK